MNKRLSRLFAFVAVLALLLSACAPAATPTAEPTRAPAPTATPEPTKAPPASHGERRE
jgi:PBP1b-binding outer membrane lipoprotein LpoB